METLFRKVWREKEAGNGVFDVVDVFATAAHHLSVDNLGLYQEGVQVFEHFFVVIDVLWFLCRKGSVAEVSSDLDDGVPVESL